MARVKELVFPPGEVPLAQFGPQAVDEQLRRLIDRYGYRANILNPETQREHILQTQIPEDGTRFTLRVTPDGSDAICMSVRHARWSRTGEDYVSATHEPEVHLMRLSEGPVYISNISRRGITLDRIYFQQ